MAILCNLFENVRAKDKYPHKESEPKTCNLIRRSVVKVIGLPALSQYFSKLDMPLGIFKTFRYSKYNYHSKTLRTSLKKSVNIDNQNVNIFKVLIIEMNGIKP